MRGRNNQELADAIAHGSPVSVGSTANPMAPQPMQVHVDPSAFGQQGQPAAQMQQQQYLPPEAYVMMQPTDNSQMDSVDNGQLYLVQRLPMLVRLYKRARGLQVLTISQRNEIATQAAIGLLGVEAGSEFESARSFAREWMRQNVK